MIVDRFQVIATMGNTSKKKITWPSLALENGLCKAFLALHCDLTFIKDKTKKRGVRAVTLRKRKSGSKT